MGKDRFDKSLAKLALHERYALQHSQYCRRQLSLYERKCVPKRENKANPEPEQADRSAQLADELSRTLKVYLQIYAGSSQQLLEFNLRKLPGYKDMREVIFAGASFQTNYDELIKRLRAVKIIPAKVLLFVRRLNQLCRSSISLISDQSRKTAMFQIESIFKHMEGLSLKGGLSSLRASLEMVTRINQKARGQNISPRLEAHSTDHLSLRVSDLLLRRETAIAQEQSLLYQSCKKLIY